MTKLENRVGSFYIWPLDIKPFPVLMASAGFYHSDIDTDTVTCFSCKLRISDWKKHDDPIQRHLQQSSIFPPCAWLDKVTEQPEQYTPPTPPTTPPLPAPGSIPTKCTCCQGTFPSSSLFHKHYRQVHKRAPRRTRIEPSEGSKRPGEGFMGRYRVSKAANQRMRRGRRGSTGLTDSD